jgi:hypothetical protein
MAAPLSAYSELPIGYGEADVEALEFTLNDDVTSDVAFLRLFVSTTYIDMLVLEQTSPFFMSRGGRKVKPPSMDVWDAWTYVIKTEESCV